MVYGRSEMIYSTNKKNKKNYIYMEGETLPDGYVFDKLIYENFIPFPSALISKEKFDECGGFSSKYKHALDYCVFLKISNKYKISAIQDVCCKYRIHDNNLSNFQNVICALEDIEITKSFFPNKHAINALKHKQLNLSIAYLKESRYLEALLHLIRNVKLKIIFDKFLKIFKV